jgi:hypothetical protein
VTPEEIGLCGCWQVIAVQRESLDLSQPDAQPTVEVGYYASSLSVAERDDAAVAAAIRGHWSAIENGTHYRRDVTLGEDANRTAHRHGAAVLASLRNLANGIYELARERGRTKVDTLRSWCQQQTFTSAWPLLQR